MKKVFNKLVRDKMEAVWKYDIENKISASGYVARHISKDETKVLLKDKLLEEVEEVCDAYAKEDKQQLKEELADVLEVVHAIMYHHGFPAEEIETIRTLKKEKKGGFEEGLYLESVDYFK